MTEDFTIEELTAARERLARSEAAMGKDFDKMTEEEFNDSLGPYLCRSDGLPPLWPRAPRWPNDQKVKEEMMKPMAAAIRMSIQSWNSSLPMVRVSDRWTNGTGILRTW